MNRLKKRQRLFYGHEMKANVRIKRFLFCWYYIFIFREQNIPNTWRCVVCSMMYSCTDLSHLNVTSIILAVRFISFDSAKANSCWVTIRVAAEMEHTNGLPTSPRHIVCGITLLLLTFILLSRGLVHRFWRQATLFLFVVILACFWKLCGNAL